MHHRLNNPFKTFLECSGHQNMINLAIYILEFSTMNVHLNSSVAIVREAMEKCSLQFVNTYPLLKSELILRITFEPQSVDDSAIQPSHQYHGCNYSS